MSAHLVTGGARSGKSAYAEALALRSGLPTTYIATARPGDDEMRARIAVHRNRRPGAWRTVECPIALADALHTESAEGSCLIVDCLTLWMANLAPGEIAAERERLAHAIEAAAGLLVIVSNELGSGVVPLGETARAFVDAHGMTNQRVAAVCERVTLMVCGIPLRVKP